MEDEKKELETEYWCGLSRTKWIVLQVVMLVVWILVFEGIGAVIGTVIGVGQGDWYDNLNQSPLTPPDIVFIIVWPIFYLSLAVLGWLLSNALNEKKVLYVFIVYWVQNIINWLWAPVFQVWHQTEASLAMLAVLLVLNAGIIASLIIIDVVIFNKLRTRYIALIIVPYFLWLCWATYLNAYIVAEN